MTLEVLDDNLARHFHSKYTAPDSIELLDASIEKKNDSVSIDASMMTEKDAKQGIARHAES